MKEKLARLKLLQAVDQILDGLKEQRESLPQDLAELESRVAAKAAARDEIHLRHKDLSSLKSSREIDRANENDRVKKYEGRLQEIKTNREYQALLREVGFAKKAAAELDDEISRLGQELETLAEQVAAADSELEQERAVLNERRSDIERTLTEVEKAYEEEKKNHESLMKEIPRDLLSRYNLVRRRTNLVVVNVGSGACHGCFMALPPQLFNQVRRVDQLYTCPNCHRILFYEQPAAEEAKV